MMFDIVFMHCFIAVHISFLNNHNDSVYEWHLMTNPDTEAQVNLAVKGRANSKERPYVYIYGEESGETASDVHNICIVNFDCLRRLLHRLLSRIGINPKLTISWDFPITFEMARAYQKANGRYLRENQWTDIVMTLTLEIG